ncbi:hypothetical protein N9D63_07910 [Opitutales bacterium]|nr:hypothetical protein [Opitutales bacterium]
MSKDPQQPKQSSEWREQALAAWRSFASDKRRLWLLGSISVALVALLVWGLFRPNVYVDGVAVRQDADWAQLRDIVWDTPSPISLDLNKSEDLYDPTVTADNLSLVFVKGRPGEGADLWTMDWNGTAWTNPRPVDELNTASSEIGPALTSDGKLLYFVSDRDGGLGGFDIWVSPRGIDGAWGDPVNLGENINSAFHEYDPALHEFSGQLYYSSNRPKRPLTEKEKDAWKGTLRELRLEEDYDLFSARFAAAEEEVPTTPDFDPAERVHALNTTSNEGQTSLSARGDFLYFSSDRKGGEGGYDIYRSRVYEGEILPPENLGIPINTPFDDMDPALTMEGHRLLFSSDRTAELARPSGVRHFGIFRTVAREVAPMRLDEDSAGGFWHFLDSMKWWLLLLLASIAALYYLLRKWAKAKEMGEVGLRARCMIGSVIFHVVLALLFSLKELVQEVIEMKEATIMEANLDVDALAMEKEALDIREETTELPEVKESSEVEIVRQYVEPVEVPTEAAEAPSTQQIENSFVVETQPAVRMEVPTPPNPVELPAETLTKPETQPIKALSFTLPTFRLEQSEPVEAQAEPKFLEFSDVAPATRSNTPIDPLEEIAEKAPSLKIQEQVELAETSAVQPVEAPESSSQATPKELSKITDLELKPSQTSTRVEVTLESDRQIEKAENIPQVQAPTSDESVAKAADLSPNAEANDSPERAEAEIRGGELAMAESALKSVEAPKNASEESDKLENLSQLPLSENNSTSQSSLALKLEGRTQLEKGDDAPEVPTPSADSAVAKAAAFSPNTESDGVPEKASTEISGGELAKAESALNSVVTPTNAHEESDKLENLTSVPLSENKATLQPSIALSLEGRTEVEKADDAADVAAPSADSAVAKVAAFSPNAESDSVPEKASTEISGGELAKAESSLNNVVTPTNTRQKLDKLENLSGIPLTENKATSQSSLTVSLEGRPEVEKGEDAPNVAAPSTDSSIAKAASFTGSPNASDSPDPTAVATTDIPNGTISKVSAANQKVSLTPSETPVSDSLAAFRHKPAPLAGGPKVSQIATRVTLENARDISGGPAEAQIAGIAADSGVDKLAALSAVTSKPLAAPSGVATLTGLKPTSSAVLKLPKFRLAASLPTVTGPKLSNPISLRLPLSGTSPQLALESKPSTDQPYILRDPKQRARVLERLGGTKESEEAVSRALDWFSRHQEKDGSWSIHKHGGQKNHDIASTSFALLCYFGWGAKHNKDGPYRETVEKGVQWLMDQAKKGDFTNGQHNGMYDHGVATLALAEAYGLTKDPSLRETLQQAVDFVVAAQNKSHGAWDYRPKSKRMDTSVSGWQLMALKSADLAGIDIPADSLRLAAVWLDRVSAGSKKGIYGYDRAGFKTSAMVAEGMFSQQILGNMDANHPRMKESADHMLQHLPKNKGKQADFYYWYYGTLSSYMNKGEVWEKWNPVMREILIDRQIKDGREEGSWDYKHGNHSKQMGRVITTAIATLSLEVYYRYLPSAKSGTAQVPQS